MNKAPLPACPTCKTVPNGFIHHGGVRITNGATRVEGLASVIGETLTATSEATKLPELDEIHLGPCGHIIVGEEMAAYRSALAEWIDGG